MTAAASHRLEGLEPDNLLAFLALLGLLRTLERADEEQAEAAKARPRAAWDIDAPPVRPRLFLARPMTESDVCKHAARGLAVLSSAHDFGGRKDLDYSRDESRAQLERHAASSRLRNRDRADLFAALVSDAAIKDDKDERVDPTPLCLLFGQGHQHFLERLASVPQEPVAQSHRRGKKVSLSEEQCLAEALFQPWRREDRSLSFRWDPEEDVRYALMAGDPTDAAYKGGTQHGANRLAAVGLGVLALAPQRRVGRTRPAIVGGAFDSEGFSFAWPIWKERATLAAVRALLAHPNLRRPETLANLGLSQVMVARRISVGKFMNFARATIVASGA